MTKVTHSHSSRTRAHLVDDVLLADPSRSESSERLVRHLHEFAQADAATIYVSAQTGAEISRSEIADAFARIHRTETPEHRERADVDTADLEALRHEGVPS